MALSMDVAIEHQASSASTGDSLSTAVVAVVPSEPMMPGSAWYEQAQQQEQQREHSVIQRVDIPCPAALRRRQHHQQEGSISSVGGSFVLLPDRAEPEPSRRFISLEAGQTTVVSEKETLAGGGEEGR